MSSGGEWWLWSVLEGCGRKGLQSTVPGDWSGGSGTWIRRVFLSSYAGQLSPQPRVPRKGGISPKGGADRGFVPTSPLSLAPLPSEAGMGVGIDGNLPPPNPLSPPHSLPFSESLRYYSAFVKKGIK